jgi:hypothetical protein
MVTTSLAGRVLKRDSVTAVVNFSNNTGAPQHLASGLLYGVPDTLDQIPVSLRSQYAVHASIWLTWIKSQHSTRKSDTTMNEQAGLRFQLQGAAGSGV